MNTLETIFEETVSLPRMSHVVYDLVEMTKNDDIEMTLLVEKIREDQAIAAKVIRMANSSFYMESGRVSSVERAVNIVGLQTLRTTVVTSGVMNSFGAIPGVEMNQYWRHVLTSAFMAIEIATALDHDPEEAFTTGLMLGLGVLLLHLRMPEEAKAIAKKVNPLDFEGRIAIEQEMLGFTHNEVAAELLVRWRFPESISNAILCYSKPHDSNLLCRIVFASAHYAYGSIRGLRERIIVSSLDTKLPGTLGLDERWFVNHREPVFKWVDSILPSS